MSLNLWIWEMLCNEALESFAEEVRKRGMKWDRADRTGTE